MSTTAPKVSSRDPLRSGLRALAGAAASPALDRIGGRRLMEKALYRGAKGVAEAESAVRGFRRRQGGADPARPAPGKAYADFDLTPTQDQQDILDAVRTFAGDILRPAAARADRDRRLPDDIRSAAGELGLHLIGIPEELGGLATERSAVTAALVLEQLAYADLSIAVALLAPAAVANAIAAYGTADQQATYLPEFVGEAPAIAALAMSEPRALADVLDPATTATRNGDEVHVVGVKSLVPLATDARLFLVLARLDGRPQLVIVEAADPGVQVVDDPAMGLRAAATGQLHVDVSIPTDRLLGTETDALEAVRRARLAWSAAAVGTCQAVLDETAAYVKDRVAFGEPVAHRQSVAFTVADMAIETDALRLVVWRAAARLDRDADAAPQIAYARALTARHATRIGSDGVQMLGGHGFTTEFPHERWYRDLRAAGVLDGVLSL